MELGSPSEQIKYHNEVADAQADVAKNKTADVIDMLIFLRRFMPTRQLDAIRSFLRGEERQHFLDKLAEMHALIEGMPKTYEQDGKGKDAIISLHYFYGSCDWYITEKDMETVQNQAFGIVNLGDGPEYGYISIVELLLSGHPIELDLYYRPRTVREQFPNL